MKDTIKIIRSNRKTLALEINSLGELIARAPYYLSERDIQNFVETKSSWIEKQLKRKEADREAFNEEGCLSEQELEKLVKFAKSIIPEKVAYYARILGVTYGRISIRKQKSRWGSCSRDGNLNFNCLLMMAPPEVLNYVVVHELSHRLEMNHSPRFWNQVERVIPDYRNSREWLKEHGNKLMLRMHGR